MSFQYHQQKNKPNKKRFLALTDAYHGETLGALSVGGVDLYNEVFQPLLLDTVRAQGPTASDVHLMRTLEAVTHHVYNLLKKN